jgi:tetratricopeptide (TPR) repeat protein
VYGGTNRPEQAAKIYRQALAIQERLAAAYPDTPAYQNDLAGTWYALGSALRFAARIDQAIAAFEQARAIQEKLAREHPHEAAYRAALSRTLSYLGALYRVAGKVQQQEVAVRETLAISEGLSQDYPENPEYQFLLGDAVATVAIFHHQSQREEQAEAAYRRALQIHEKLAHEHPDVPEYIGRVGFTNMALGMTLGAQNKQEAALAAYDKAIEAAERALAKEPRNPSWRTQLRNAHIMQAGMALLTHGDYAQAVRQADAIARQEGLDLGNFWNLVLLYCNCAAAAGKDTKLTSRERAKLQEDYGSQAVTCLRLAIDKGFRELALIKSNQELDPLRGRADFKRLVQETEEKMKK